MKESIDLISELVTILAFIWAIYEFYIKRRFMIKAKATPSLLNKPSEFLFDFEVINFSEQSLGRIGLIGVWIKRWNSFGQFWDIELQDAGYHEKITFSQDLSEFIRLAVNDSIRDQTWWDRLFKPKLVIALKTHMNEELKVHIEQYHQKSIDDKLNSLFREIQKKYEK